VFSPVFGDVKGLRKPCLSNFQISFGVISVLLTLVICVSGENLFHVALVRVSIVWFNTACPKWAG